MTGAAWSETGSGTVNSATTFTFVAQNDVVHQSYTPASDVNVTLYVRARAVTGNTSLHLYHSGLTPASTAKTFTGTLADYAVTVAGDGGAVVFGIQDQNAAGHGQIEVTRWAVFPATLSAVEAAAAYEKVGADRQEISDHSGNSNTLQIGSSTSSDTNDPSHLIESYNLAIPGTTDDLQHASWTTTNASAGSATQFTPSATDGQIVQSFTGVSSSVYIVSATIASAGNTSLEWTLDGVETGVTVTASPVRYHVEYTGDGAAADIGLRDPNGAGYGAITFTDFQIERAPTGNDPLPYISSAEPVFVAAHADYTTDDYTVSTLTPLATDSTYALLFRRTNSAAIHTIIGDNKAAGGILMRAETNDDLRLYADTNNAGKNIVGGAPGDNLWHIAVVTYTASTKTFTVYLDGALLGSQSFTAGITTDGNLRLGAWSVGVAHPLTGALPLVIVDDSVWSPSKTIAVTCDVAQQMWDERSIAVFGATAQCAGLTFDETASIPTEGIFAASFAAAFQ
jgi:hypothetical protein